MKIAEPFGCFSNFSRHPITIEGKKWMTTEHWYQAQKFEDTELREKVRLAGSPWVAAQIGRDPELPLRPDWEQIKVAVMEQALRYKVEQNPEVKEILLYKTGDDEIVEHTPRDHYWADGGDGSGKNMLGKLWMKIRDELRKKQEDKAKVIDEYHVEEYHITGSD